MKSISKICFLTACLLPLPLQSCGIARSAADEAKQWWEENRDEVIKTTVTSAANAAKRYWEENRGKILDHAKEAAERIGSRVLTEAKGYVDTKLEEGRKRLVARLLEKGYKIEDIDLDGDGEVSDDELAAFMKANPKTWWYLGAGGIGWYLLWQLRKRQQAQGGGAKPPSS